MLSCSQSLLDLSRAYKKTSDENNRLTTQKSFPQQVLLVFPENLQDAMPCVGAFKEQPMHQGQQIRVNHENRKNEVSTPSEVEKKD